MCPVPENLLPGIQRTARTFSAHHQRSGLRGPRSQDSTFDSEWLRRIAAERKTGSAQRTPARSSARHAGQRKTPAAVHSGFSDVQRAGNRRLAHAVRAWQHQRCLSEVCRLWSNRFQEKGLALYFLANDKLPVFPFDSPKLERVISNLLENAFKFTPQGGTVWLHAEPHMWERRAAAHAVGCRAQTPECDASQLGEESAFPTPGRASPRNFIWKCSTISFACRAREVMKAWD